MGEGKPFVKTGRLFDIADAFRHSPETDALFDEAMAECFEWHRQRCPEFARFLVRKGFSPTRVLDRPEEIPPLFVTIFKHFRLVSIPDEEIEMELTSSGTAGQRSAIVLDRRSLKRFLKLVDQTMASLDLVNRTERVNYLNFTYDPKFAANVGTAFTDKVFTGLTRRKKVVYCIKWNPDTAAFEFDLEDTVTQLLRFARQAEPVRILGFPAYLWQVCDVLEKRGKTLHLGDRSFVITGGGWKIHKDREVPKEVFKERVAGLLGLPAGNIRDSFGMVEHGIGYIDCHHGRAHIPIYARARVLDPETLEQLPPYTPGLLHLMTPYLTSYPSISLLTTDSAQIEYDCPCGRPGPTLRVLGRAGLSKHKGCAITALELLKT